MSRTPVRVLVVDDSAFARKVVREVLAGAEDVEVVATARDGLDALEKIAALRPDVVTLDLVMPGLDGVGVLRALQGRPSPPAVVVVSIAGDDSELGVTALELGAFDVVTKPTALAIDRLYDLGAELCAKVLAAVKKPAPPSGPPALAPAAPSGGRTHGGSLVLIGGSTGGPQAITRLVHALPATFPLPIAIVVHMPEGYTDSFARRIDAGSELNVAEARAGMRLEAGRAVIARAGKHLTFRVEAGSWVCSLDDLPANTPHRPSVDAMFESGAGIAGTGCVGIVLTGMGNDGVAGCRAIRAAGGRVLTEAESSCVVYGMPRSVCEAGLSNAVAPIESMAALLLESM